MRDMRYEISISLNSSINQKCVNNFYRSAGAISPAVRQISTGKAGFDPPSGGFHCIHPLPKREGMNNKGRDHRDARYFLISGTP